jgi:predicted RNA-binding Zn ribbon-like protein
VAIDRAGAAALAPATPDLPGALGLVLAVVREAQADGTWARLKTCPGHHCGWAFYDHSRNNAGTWCSMRVCGGREKARAYRRRSRAPRRGAEA